MACVETTTDSGLANKLPLLAHRHPLYQPRRSNQARARNDNPGIQVQRGYHRSRRFESYRRELYRWVPLKLFLPFGRQIACTIH